MKQRSLSDKHMIDSCELLTIQGFSALEYRFCKDNMWKCDKNSAKSSDVYNKIPIGNRRISN